jgi:hypothetical protein
MRQIAESEDDLVTALPQFERDRKEATQMSVAGPELPDAQDPAHPAPVRLTVLSSG